MKIIPLSILLYINVSLTLCNSNIVVKGPGLQPHKTVLPARYFYIYLNNNDSAEQVDITALDVSITGYTLGGKVPCRLWKQVLNLNDSSVIVRYKLYETCFDLQIGILLNSKYVAGSPFFFKGPILPEDCNCPVNDFEKWYTNFGCKVAANQISNDLSKYSNVDFEKFHDKVEKRFNNSMSSSICHYVIKSNEVYRTCYGKYVDFKMFMDGILLSLMRKVSFPDFEMFVNLGDWPLMDSVSKNNFPLFSWCGSHDTVDIVMPTYDLTESTLENMGRVSLDMLSVQGNIGKKWNEKENKAFWRGRDSSLERLHLVDLSRKYPNLINASLTNFFFFMDKQQKYGPKSDHVSFFKFFDFKYQLCLDGTVAAYRFPYLLAGDSLVFKQDSKYYEHFYSDLQPWVHYIPIKNNLEDLVEKLKWASENDEKAQEIAQSGQMYTRNNLMPQDIFCYHANLFNEWSKKLESPVVIRKGMENVKQKNSKGCVCEQIIKDEL